MNDFTVKLLDVSFFGHRRCKTTWSLTIAEPCDMATVKHEYFLKMETGIFGLWTVIVSSFEVWRVWCRTIGRQSADITAICAGSCSGTVALVLHTFCFNEPTLNWTLSLWIHEMGEICWAWNTVVTRDKYENAFFFFLQTAPEPDQALAHELRRDSSESAGEHRHHAGRRRAEGNGEDHFDPFHLNLVLWVFRKQLLYR